MATAISEMKVDLNTGFQTQNSPTPAMPSLKQQTARGVKWLAGASLLQKVLSVGTTVILARILEPSVFGLFSLAFVAIDALGLFKSMGFDSALIQRKDNIEKAAGTAFFIIPVLGILMFFILTVSAPYIGGFLNSREVIPVMRCLGLIFIFSCFCMVPKALLQREMQFSKVALAETAGAVCYSAVSVALALSGWGIWSLVIGYLTKTIVSGVAVWSFAQWRLRWGFDTKIAVEMFHFGKFLFLSGLVWFLRTNLNNILVGKLLGVTALGLYAIAFNISHFFVDYLGLKVNQVVYPAYSRLQNELNKLRQAVLQTNKYLSVIVIPFGVFLFLLSGEFLRVVYGEEWTDAAGVLRFLAWAGIFNGLPVSFGAALLACGRAKLSFCLISLQVVLFLGLIAPLAKLLGINGVGIVVTFAGLVSFIATVIFIVRILKVRIKEIYWSFHPALMAAFVMALVIIFLKPYLLHYRTGFFLYCNFAFLFFLSAGIYFAALLRLDRKIAKEFKSLLFS